MGCPYAKGLLWICISSSGSYFVFEVEREINILTFEPSINPQLGVINEKTCTIVRDHWILCLSDINFEGGVLNILKSHEGFIPLKT